MSHWHGSPDTSKFGFIYEITNTVDGRKYIGCKQFYFKKTRPPLKGKKRKRVDYVESDWTNYTGSSPTLNKDIEKLGIENFRFEILYCVDSKYMLKYCEVKEIITRNALLSDDYYNNNIMIRLGKAPKPPAG
jgi:hypothetical protein